MKPQKIVLFKNGKLKVNFAMTLNFVLFQNGAKYSIELRFNEKL